MSTTDNDDCARQRMIVFSTSGRSEVFQDFQRRQTARAAHDSAARMRGRSAHIEVLDRRPKPRLSRDWAQKEKLLKRKLALKNIALAQAPLALQIERRKDLLCRMMFLKLGACSAIVSITLLPKASL